MTLQDLATAAATPLLEPSTEAALVKPHVLVDLRGCCKERLNDLAGIRLLLLDTARSLGCTIIGDIFHQFSPHGVTGIIAIAESHLSIHTWVENGYAAVDLFLCNAHLSAQELDRALATIGSFLKAAERAVTVVQRGAA